MKQILTTYLNEGNGFTEAKIHPDILNNSFYLIIVEKDEEIIYEIENVLFLDSNTSILFTFHKYGLEINKPKGNRNDIIFAWFYGKNAIDIYLNFIGQPDNLPHVLKSFTEESVIFMSDNQIRVKSDPQNFLRLYLFKDTVYEIEKILKSTSTVPDLFLKSCCSKLSFLEKRGLTKSFLDKPSLDINNCFEN